MKSSPSSFAFLFLLFWFGLSVGTCPPTFSCPLQGCERAQEPEPILSFCEDYQELSCCDYADDTEVSIYILTEIAQTFGLQQCVSSFSELECGYKCDPRQKEFVNVIEGGLNEYVICRDFCERFYNNCKGSPFNGGLVEDFYLSAEAFCTNSGRDNVRIILAEENCFNGPQMAASSQYSLVMDLQSNLAGDPNSFVVNVVNEIGIPVDEGGDLVELEVVNPSGENVTWWATDYGDGSYLMTYEPDEQGLYNITVTINDQPLHGSPETIYSVSPSSCPVYNDRVSMRANPSLPICSWYDENACCTAEDSDVAAVEDWLSGIRDTYGSAPHCVALFESFACGLLCSPAQAIFVNITQHSGGSTTGSGTTGSTTGSASTTGSSTTGAFSTGTTGSTTGRNNTTTGPISTTGVFTTTGGSASTGTTTGGGGGDQIAGDYRVCGYFCYDLYLACSNVILMTGFTVQETFGSAAPFCRANNLYSSRFNLQLVGQQCYGGQAQETFPPTSYYTDADTCLTAGETGSLTVQAVDKYLTKQTKFGESLQIKFTGPVIFYVGGVQDNRDGTYVATYSPTLAGTYSVNVVLVGGDVQGSPFEVEVRPGPVSTTSLVQGVQTTLDAGQIASFVIIARDQYSNLLTTGGDDFNVRLTGPEFVSVELIDNCDGTYIAIYTPTTPGNYTLHVDLNNTEFYSSIITVGQNGGGLPNQRFTFASGPGVTSPVDAGVETEFTIYVVDVNGNLVSTGGDLFVVTLVLTTGEVIEELQVKSGIVDNQDGTYLVTYTPDFTGFFWIYITLDDANIRDSPFYMESVGNFTCPKNCSDNGRCTSNGTCICDKDDYGLDNWTSADCGVAPKPFFAQVYFSSTGASIFAHFNIPTDQAGLTGEFPCSEIIVDDADYIRRFGNPSIQAPFCVFRNSSLLIIYLGADATVVPGNVLLLKPGTIRSEDGTSGFGVYSPFDSDIIQMFLPPPIPQIVITGPTNMSSCSPLQLDASATYGTGGRTLQQWVWGVRDGPPETQLDILKLQLNQKTTNKMSLSATLVADLLVSGWTYVFTVKATNFLGGESEVVEFPVTVGFYPIPLAIAQPSYFNSIASKDLKINADGEPSGCSPVSLLSEDLVFTWIRIAGPVFQVDNTSSSKSLFIPAYTLISGYDYTLELRVGYESTPWLFGVAHVHIHVPYSAPAAILAGGTYRLWQLGVVPLTLDASQSVNFDVPPDPMIYHWNCTVLGDRDPLADRYFTPAQECFDSDVLEDFLPSENSTIEFEAGALGLATYDFGLTLVAFEGGPSSFVSTRVVTNYRGPNVLITISKVESMFPANPNEELTLQANLAAYGPVDWQWEVVSHNLDLTDQTLVSSKPTSSRLILEPGAFASGVLYKFRLNGTNGDAVGSAELDLLANARPNAGACQVSPTTGIAAETVFRIQCSYWEDDVSGQPSHYKFFLQSGKELVALHAGDINCNILDVLLPSGQQTIVAQVYDRWGAYTSFLLPVTVHSGRKRYISERQSNLGEVSSSVGDLSNQINDGNTNAVGQLIFLNSDELNTLETGDLEEKIALREQLGQHLINDFAIEDSASANFWRIQLVVALTSEPEELSPELLVSLSDYVLKLSQSPLVGDVTTLTTFYNAISNIFTSAIMTSSLTSEISVPLRASFDNLLIAQAEQLNFGKARTSISSDNGDIITRTQFDDPETIASLVQLSGEAVSFHFSQETWDYLSSTYPRMIYQVLEFEYNIYSWSSDEVIAPIGFISLLDEDLNPISLDASPFNVSFDGRFQDDLEKPNKPVCSTFNNPDFTSDSCTLLSFTEDRIVCECDQIHDFSVLQSGNTTGPQIVPSGADANDPLPSFSVQGFNPKTVDFHDWILVILVISFGALILIILRINHRRKRPKTSKHLWEKRLLLKQILSARAENVSDFSLSDEEDPQSYLDTGNDSEDSVTREERRRNRMATRLMRLDSKGLKPATHQDWEQRYATTRTHRPAFTTDEEARSRTGLPSTTTRLNKADNTPGQGSAPAPRKYSQRQISGQVGKKTTAYSRTEIEN